MVKWPLALSDHITGFLGTELVFFVLFFVFFLQFRKPVAYGFMIHKDGP